MCHLAGGVGVFSEPAGHYCTGSIFRLLASIYLNYSIIIMIHLALILGSYWQLPGEH